VLDIAPSTFPNVFKAVSNRARRSSYLVTSILTNATGSVDSFWASVSPASASMSPDTILALRLHNLSTVAAPMPLPLPKMEESTIYFNLNEFD
jgi:hypothetical protein